MAHKYLLREDAPIGEELWKLLDSTMAEAAKSYLTGRRILPLEGPFGFGLKAVPMEDCIGEGEIISSTILPIHLIQRTFSFGKRDLAAFEMNGLPLNMETASCAALDCARMEDGIIFHGTTGQDGLVTLEESNSVKLSSWNTVGKAADDIIQAITTLDRAGFHGPYSMALAPNRFNLLLRQYPQGGTELEHVRTIISQGVYKAPILETGGVVLAAGRQYASIILGQDMTVGFNGPVEEDFEFTISESLGLMIRQLGAICVLKEK